MKTQSLSLTRFLLTAVLLFGLLAPSATAAPVGENLLTNPGFESGLSNGWNTTPLWSRGNENSTPTPYEGDYYLRPAMPIADVTIAQEIDLTTLGLDSHRLRPVGIALTWKEPFIAAIQQYRNHLAGSVCWKRLPRDEGGSKRVPRLECEVGFRPASARHDESGLQVRGGHELIALR